MFEGFSLKLKMKCKVKVSYMITSIDKIMNSVNIISTMSFYGGKNVTEILNCLWTKAFAIFIFLHCLALLSAKIWLKILTGDQIMATFKC